MSVGEHCISLNTISDSALDATLALHAITLSLQSVWAPVVALRFGSFVVLAVYTEGWMMRVELCWALRLALRTNEWSRMMDECKMPIKTVKIV